MKRNQSKEQGEEEWGIQQLQQYHKPLSPSPTDVNTHTKAEVTVDLFQEFVNLYPTNSVLLIILILHSLQLDICFQSTKILL